MSTRQIRKLIIPLSIVSIIGIVLWSSTYSLTFKLSHFVPKDLFSFGRRFDWMVRDLNRLPIVEHTLELVIWADWIYLRVFQSASYVGFQEVSCACFKKTRRKEIRNWESYAHVEHQEVLPLVGGSSTLSQSARTELKDVASGNRWLAPSQQTASKNVKYGTRLVNKSRKTRQA